jgi:ABC-2 type transport system permease protein
VWAAAFLILISISFSLFGFILGLWADGFEKLQIVPIMIITPLTFLGGTFYSITMLPPTWQAIAMFNPIVYLVNGFRWAFYGQSDVGVVLSLGMILLFMGACVVIITWIFRTGWRLRT